MAGYETQTRWKTVTSRELIPTAIAEGTLITLGLVLGLLALTPALAQSPDDALAQRGKAVAQLHCARCHVVTPENRMTGISSTPSFMIMVSALEDWHDRFATFLARRPHPAHLRFENEPPRPQESPATLAEVVLSQNDLEAILAYAERLAATSR